MTPELWIEWAVVFDAIICNTDRHFGTFGFRIDNAVNRIIAPAPLFDHGNGLFNFAGKAYMTSKATLQEYANIRLPRAYEGFMGMARTMKREP